MFSCYVVLIFVFRGSALGTKEQENEQIYLHNCCLNMNDIFIVHDALTVPPLVDRLIKLDDGVLCLLFHG